MNNSECSHPAFSFKVAQAASGSAPENAEIYFRMRVIGRKVDAGKRDQPSPGYFEFALDHARQVFLDLVGQPGIAPRIMFGLVNDPL